MSTVGKSTTLWRHRQCDKEMSFALTDRPNVQGEYCDICRSDDTEWIFVVLLDGQGNRIDLPESK